MTTLLDDLDDEEIEASLLWTDDEDDNHESIDPLDEELLLSDIDPVKTTHFFDAKTVVKLQEPTPNGVKVLVDDIAELKETYTCQDADSDESFTQNDSIDDEIKSKMFGDDSIVEKTVIRSSENCADAKDQSDTTLTGEFVDLNVTFNTRDVLETSFSEVSENTTLCLDQTIPLNEPVYADEKQCDSSPTELENDSVEVLNGKLSLVPNEVEKECESSNVESSCDKHVAEIQNGDGIEGKLTNISLREKPTDDIDNDQTTNNCLNSNTQCKNIEVANTEVATDMMAQRSDNCELSRAETAIGVKNYPSTNIIIDLTVTDESNSVIDHDVSTQSEDKTVSTITECIDIRNSTREPLEAANAISNEGSSPIDDAIKSIRQAVAKRAKSLSSEQKPLQKRCRSVSEQLAAIDPDQKRLKVEANSLPTGDINTSISHEPPCDSSTVKRETVNRKKPIVSFNFQNYSTNGPANPYICKICSTKFKEELKFESHLVANHAMALNINDFNIDLHQYYKQKREKLFAQSKNTLPRLTSQEGVVDQALIKDYNQNVKIITSPCQKNSQYFCKICENVYSTKNLIIEHLKSSKHILRKNMNV